MTTASNTLAQLEEMWENAEPGPFKADDAIIMKYVDGTYALRSRAGYSGEKEVTRVFERAKPKAPEWEAVVASVVHDEEHKREVYSRTPSGAWESVTRYTESGSLVDPVPLVELPEREDLLAALREGWNAWKHDEECAGGADGHRADALLKLLKGR